MRVTFQAGAAATGNGTAHSAKNVDKCGIQVSGTFVGTVEFEGTIDGTNWGSLSATPLAGGAAVTSATAPGIWVADVEGIEQIRARVGAYTSGAITVDGSLSKD